MSEARPVDLISTSEVLALFPPKARPSHSTLLIWSRRGHFVPFYRIFQRRFKWSRQAVIDWLVCRGILPSEITSKGE